MIRMKKKLMEIIIVTVFLSIFTEPVFGLRNPAAVYCEALGYEYMIQETLEGQIGLCKFPDGSSCADFDFLKGKCGDEYSYCKNKGYGIKTVAEPKKCGSPAPEEECAVCVLENGAEVEVIRLMGLDFREGLCGDGFCVFGETYENCPQDCPSGSFDAFCDSVKDGICDPDCSPEQDSDCVSIEKKREEKFEISWFLTPLTLGILFIFVLLVVLFKFKKKREYRRTKGT